MNRSLWPARYPVLGKAGGVVVEITLPGRVVIRAAGAAEQHGLAMPQWGVYADTAWSGWPGRVLEWPDFGVPAEDNLAVAAVIEAVERARSGEDVLVGCLGGTGRTGTLLAAMAVATGVPAEKARDWVRHRYRPGAVETDGQLKWVTNVVAHDERIMASARSTRDRRLRQLTAQFRGEMVAALHAGSRGPVLAWAIPDMLAITQRPLRAHPVYGGSRRDYPSEARPEIEFWITDLVGQGIRSVVALTSTKELAHYDLPAGHDGGLLALYGTAGLHTAHVPADDPAHDLTARAAFAAAVDDLAAAVAERLSGLPRPVVMHCSAAIDRAPPVAARLAFLAELNELQPTSAYPR
jgi:protein-tyrosine phosphatase